MLGRQWSVSKVDSPVNQSQDQPAAHHKLIYQILTPTSSKSHCDTYQIFHWKMDFKDGKNDCKGGKIDRKTLYTNYYPSIYVYGQMDYSMDIK